MNVVRYFLFFVTIMASSIQPASPMWILSALWNTASNPFGFNVQTDESASPGANAVNDNRKRMPAEYPNEDAENKRSKTDRDQLISQLINMGYAQAKQLPSNIQDLNAAIDWCNDNPDNSAPQILKEDEDAEFKLALQQSLTVLSKPEKHYVEFEKTVSNDIASLIAICDITHSHDIFQTKIFDSGSITQLPTTCQSYAGLATIKDYDKGHDRLCGYYAAHNAKIFASNPDSTQQQLIELINNREEFVTNTLRPGKAFIQKNRLLKIKNSKNKTAVDTINLLGEEVESLLPNAIKNCVFVVGAAQDSNFEQVIAERDAKVNAFLTGELGHLVWILPACQRDHWVCALTRRSDQGLVEIIIADSLGYDRINDREVFDQLREILNELA